MKIEELKQIISENSADYTYGDIFDYPEIIEKIKFVYVFKGEWGILCEMKDNSDYYTDGMYFFVPLADLPEVADTITAWRIASYNDSYQTGVGDGIVIVDDEVVNIENYQHLIGGFVAADYAAVDYVKRELLTVTDRYYSWTSERSRFIRYMLSSARDEGYNTLFITPKQAEECAEEWEKTIETVFRDTKTLYGYGHDEIEALPYWDWDESDDFSFESVLNDANITVKSQITIEEFVKEMFNSQHVSCEKIDIETARTDLNNFRNSEYEMPDDMTAEDFMTAWNELVDEVEGE